MEEEKPPQSTEPNPLMALESALVTACDTLSTLTSLATNFTYDNQDLIFAKVNELVRDLQTIDERAKNTEQSVPMEVLDAIDRGKNPEQTTLQVLEASAEANNVALGKLKAMALFRDELDKQVQSNGLILEDPKKALEEIDAAVQKAQAENPNSNANDALGELKPN